MSNLDEMLAQLGGAPLPPRLAMMDVAVFSALAAGVDDTSLV